MDRVDRLITKAKPVVEPWMALAVDNPFMDKGSLALLDMMSGDRYSAPEMHTREWEQFIFALMHSESQGGLTE